MKKAAIALIVLGVAFLALEISGLSPFSGGLVLILIVGLPCVGAFLWFADRALSRPAGIDNDDIFRDAISTRGWTAIIVGTIITGLYVVIYLGDRISLGERQALIGVNAAGVVAEVQGDRSLLNAAGAKVGETEGVKLFGGYTGITRKLPEILAKSAAGEAAKASVGWNHRYRYSANVETIADGDANPGETVATVYVVQKDSVHAFFMRNVYHLLNPISTALSGRKADNWFFYSFLYTLAVVVFGVRMILKYRHNRYQMIRSGSVMFVQAGFGFLIPNILILFKQPGYYFSYFWPLKPEYLYPSTWSKYLAAGDASLGVAFLGFGAMMTFVGTPVLTYFYGKRWYCSWVCGCGGLAETAGDPWRQLSDKSLKAWQIERWLIHGVLVAIIGVTALLWINSVSEGAVFGRLSAAVAEAYGFYIGMLFSGIVGVGFYPLMGNRVWCRFGCPMAAILGLQQKFFSRFRITTNGGQCISCGNCSTYCEMGIDVKWYAQRGQNIVRASCVGCGVCSAVCPRGVLRLENGPVAGRVPAN